jgi:hypothetical protein
LSPTIAATLLCHPASPCRAVGRIEAVVTLSGDGGLALRYRVHGAPEAIRLPPPQPAGPADELWRHTCCEAFIATVDGPDYREFNFSPAGQWAAYRFTGYRERDAGFSPAAAPRISLQRLADGFQLDARLAPALLPAERTLALGLSTVIETSDGSKSYWALAHGAARPDFHLRQSFILTLNRNPP